MKRVLLFIIVLALLAVFMSSCNAEPEEDKVFESKIVDDEVAEDEVIEDAATEDEATEDEVIEDKAPEEENLQNKYNIIYTPSDKAPEVSPEQLRTYWDEDTDRYGYKTEDGEIIIPAIFRASTIFFEGLAAVCREWGGALEYIDASGKTILTVEGIEGSMAIDYYGFQPPCIFNDGVAVIYDGGFCIDKYGNRLNIENPEGMYKCGLIAVRDPATNLKGYADIDGNIVIPCKYADVRDFEPQGVALVFSEETTTLPKGLENRLRGYINTKGEEIIPLEYYDSPTCGASYIHPIHRDVDGMIELYKDGYYYYFTYDGTLVDKHTDTDGLTYTLVEPTYSELQKIRNKLGIISATFSGDYDCETDNAYQTLFCWDDLQDYYIPNYDDEITQYIAKPMHTDNGYVYWDKVIYENDPLGKFEEIPSEVLDENGVLDPDLYFKYWQENGDIPTAGYSMIDGAFLDWLVEGVWNGNIEHDNFLEFDDNTKLYYHDGNYYSRWTEGGRGGGVFFNAVLYDVIELGDYKYEAHFVNMDESDKPSSYITMVIGMKRASNGFRFWSIYSIDEEIIKNTEQAPLTYASVSPTQQELDEIHEKLDIVFSVFLEDYDSTADNAYEKLFEYNELNEFYVPEYEDEIIKYISKPYYTRSDGVNAWYVIIDSRDPQLEFGEIPEEILDKRGMLDMDLYSEYSDKIGDDFGFTLSGYYTYDANFIDWLVEGVWNGKVDHETVFEFSDKEKLYYCHYNNNYYTRRFEMDRGGGVFYGTRILGIKELDGYKYELMLEVVNDIDEHECYASAVIGMKESSNGFRFWSIYSIDYNIDYDIDAVLEEENLQNKYNIIYTPSDKAPSVLPEELKVFYDEKTHRYGYETENGKIIIPAIFRASTIFFEGLAAVCREWDGPLEYIDASGKTVLTVEEIDGLTALDPYGFQPPCIFNDGVAVVYDGGFCIDKNGNRLNIKNPEGMYKCGLIAVRDPATNLKGYADIDGNIVIPCKYDDVRDFEPQGVALVFSDEKVFPSYLPQSSLRGYINTKGEEIIPLEYYDSPTCGASYIYPIHRDVDWMIELYKDGYYYYFTYDGTLVEKVADEYSTETEE